MPRPTISAIKGGTSSKPKRTNTAQTLDTRSLPRANTNRSRNAAPLPTFTVTTDRSRKRPAEDRHRSESSKRPRGSPRTAKEPAFPRTPTRKVSGAYDDIRIRSASSTPNKLSTRSARDKSGVPSNTAVTPARHKRTAPGTVSTREKPAFIDLTGKDVPTSPLASRSHKSSEIVELTSGDESHTPSARPRRLMQSPCVRQPFKPETALALGFTTPTRAGCSAPSHTHSLASSLPQNGLAYDLPRRGATNQEYISLGPETRSKGHEGRNSAREEALTVPVSHERPAPVSDVGDADPGKALNDAISDESITAQATNTYERPDAAIRLGGETSTSNIPTAGLEAALTPKPSSDYVFLDTMQPAHQREASDNSSSVDSSDDDSGDEEYLPASQRSRTRTRPRSPRTPRATRLVTLRVPPTDRARQLLVRLARRPELPIGGACFFARLPAEVLQRIYRHLLRARGPVRMLNGWSRLARLQRRERLYPAILSVSRSVFEVAVRVLYAENVFQYVVRDTRGDQVVRVDSARAIDVWKYARYFRDLEVRVERNRIGPGYGDALVRALDVLRDGGACLRRLTIDIDPRIEEGETVSMAGWFEKGGLANAGLKALDTSFIQVQMSTPATDSDAPKSLRGIIDKRSEVGDLQIYQRRDERRHGDSPDLGEEDTRDLIRHEQAEVANRRLDELSSQISNACRSRELAVQEGWFEQFEGTQGRPDYAGLEGTDNLNDEDADA